MNDLQIARRLRARRRFRNVVRQVICNLYWLLDTNNMKLGENVRQNITVIYGNKKVSANITLEEKCLLRKNAEWRTEEEKEKLYRALGGLKVFRKWPDDVKFKLVSCTYFLYYKTGKTIVKQNRFAHGLYFILAGEVDVIQEVLVH